MKLVRILAGLFIFTLVAQSYATNATAAQYLYMVSKVIPEKKNVAIFMSNELLGVEKGKLERAAANFALKITIYVIDSPKAIGESLKKIEDNSVLVVYETPVLDDKSSKMFILSKCKESGIPVVSSSVEYAKSGAFIGIIVNEKHKMAQLLINLQNYSEFASKFTEEFNLALGVTEVIK